MTLFEINSIYNYLTVFIAMMIIHVLVSEPDKENHVLIGYVISVLSLFWFRKSYYAMSDIAPFIANASVLVMAIIWISSTYKYTLKNWDKIWVDKK